MSSKESKPTIKTNEDTISELLKFSKESITQLIDKTWNMLQSGQGYVQTKEESFRLSISAKALKAIEVEGIPRERMEDMIDIILVLTERMIHRIQDPNGDFAKQMRIENCDEEKLKLFWSKVNEIKLIDELDYLIHSKNKRLVSNEIDYNTKLVSFVRKNAFVPLLDITLAINSPKGTETQTFEIGKNDLTQLIKELQAMEKEINKIHPIKIGDNK